MYLIVLLYALFAGTFSLGKVLACNCQPIFLVGVRMFCAGTLLLIYEFILHGTQWRFDRNHSWYYVQIILFTTYIPYSLRFWALRSETLTASKACLLYNLSPFMTYLFSYLLCSEKVTLKKVIGLIIGFVGFIPNVIPSLHNSANNFIAPHWISIPELAIFLSVASLSYGWILIHQLVKLHNYQATTINSISMFCGGLLALATSWLFESGGTVQNVGSFITILAVVVVVSNLICHNLYVTLLKKYTPTFLSFASFLSPLFAAFYGWLFLNEPTNWTFWMTALCVLTGLALFYQDELSTEQAQPLVKPSSAH